MDQGHIQEILDHFDTGIDRYIRAVDKGIESHEQAVTQTNKQIYDHYTALVAAHQVRLISITGDIFAARVAYTEKLLYHASPELLVVLAAIWEGIKWVYKTAMFIIDLIHLREILFLADILSTVWPALRKFRAKVLGKIAEFSETLGWGADGLIHLVHAAQGGLNVMGGLMGKDWDWLESRRMDEALDTATHISAYAGMIAQDPGSVLDLSSFLSSKWTLTETGGWWKETSGKLQAGIDRGMEAFEGITGVTSELSALQNNMPEVVRKNIPAAIWDSLEQVDGFISDTLLPRLQTLDRTIDQINSALDSQRAKAAELANRLAHPGTNLLTIDDLPEYARVVEERYLDDVTSRRMAGQVEKDISGMAPDLAAFELIDAALRAPTPEPPFMALESPARAAITGIVTEPGETWFVKGDY